MTSKHPPAVLSSGSSRAKLKHFLDFSKRIKRVHELHDPILKVYQISRHDSFFFFLSKVYTQHGAGLTTSRPSAYAPPAEPARRLDILTFVQLVQFIFSRLDPSRHLVTKKERVREQPEKRLQRNKKWKYFLNTKK